MWTCPECQQQFLRNNQSHSCRDKVIADFFKGKNPRTYELFTAFAERLAGFGLLTVHPTKSMIAFASKKRMAYLTRVGKDFIDVFFIFNEPYNDNLCFHRIGQVPGSEQYNHHFRMYSEDDLNEEVELYMKKLFELFS